MERISDAPSALLCKQEVAGSIPAGSIGRYAALLLEATRRVTIALVPPRERKRRQPGLATDDPAFVGRRQLIGGIEGSQVHFDLVRGAGEDGCAAAGAEESPLVVTCLALDRHRVL